jgi:hypothetical protein
MLPDVHLALEGANGGAWGACEDARRGCADRPARVKFAKCILVVIHLSHCMRQKAPRTLTNRWPRDCRCCDLGGEGSAARSPHEPSIGGSAPRPFSGDAIAASRKSSLACKGPGEDPCDTVSSCRVAALAFFTSARPRGACSPVTREVHARVLTNHISLHFVSCCGQHH